MKKLVLLFAVMLIGVSVQAKAVDRVVVEDATVEEVGDTILKVIDMYSGVVSPIKIDKNSHIYVVNYNLGTFTDVIGIGNKSWTSKEYAKASFSCSLKELNDKQDVLMTCRKTERSSWFGRSIVFNHYKKVYNELRYEGKTVRKYKKA